MTASTDQRTSGMLRQRHTQSDLTHRAVKAAVERSRASGIIQSAAGIARDAHTTESFLYRHEGRPCQLCREVFDGGPISYYRAQMASITQARDRDADREGRVTAATIQADLANAKAANQRKRQQIRALERRLGEVLGTSAQNSIAELQRSADDGEPSPQRLAQMAEQIATLKATLSERGQELDAVRRLNADLTRQLNQRTGASPISAICRST